MKNIAIITARSGSKGLVNKNILPLKELPLISWTIKAAIESKLFDEVFVSTDSEEYAIIAEKYGAVAHPLRCKELSKDTTPSSEVLLDIINSKPEFDNFCLLQPTSPFRNDKHIIEAFELFKDNDANAVISFMKSDKSPNIINTINENGTVDNFLKVDSKSYARQNEVNYIPNGAIFFVNCDYYKKHVDFYKEKSYPYIMDKISSVDIDDELDYLFCKFLIENNKV